ncbi:MAG: ZIP family metal transporter [Brevinematia bacterium]
MPTEPIILVAMGVLFTWTMNNIGSSLVFAFPKSNKKVFDFSLGLAGGIMLASSIWSLLVPAMETSDYFHLPSWLTVGGAFIAGSLLIKLVDTLTPHLHIGSVKPEGTHSKLTKKILLYLAMTLHNIPEGFAVGIALGGTGIIPEYSGIPVAIGIGIQNIPEGLAISTTLVTIGLTKLQGFAYGVLSGFTEVVGGFIGFLIIASFPQLFPLSLAISAGAMFYVIIEEVIPEAQSSENTDIPTLGAVLGFVIMTILDNLSY